ncbi:hypothetical protein J4233_06350 [Candidatus Pacearchaeota archaeon]|nr:hypothetical protein [Candidatus Pacearchaeota archaeon]
MVLDEKGNEKVMIKNRKPMIKVIVFAVCLAALVGVLTIERNIILEKESLVSNDAKTETGNSAASTVKKDIGNYGKLNFQELSYDISDLLDNDIVKDLPKNAVIELKLGEKYYTVSRDSVSVGKASSPDLTITLPASYAGQISSGLCEMARKASQNKELGVEIHSSQTALMWKYRGMLKYRDCLG